MKNKPSAIDAYRGFGIYNSAQTHRRNVKTKHLTTDVVTYERKKFRYKVCNIEDYQRIYKCIIAYIDRHLTNTGHLLLSIQLKEININKSNK